MGLATALLIVTPQITTQPQPDSEAATYYYVRCEKIPLSSSSCAGVAMVMAAASKLSFDFRSI